MKFLKSLGFFGCLLFSYGWQLLPQHTIQRGFIQGQGSSVIGFEILVNGNSHFVENRQEWVSTKGDHIELKKIISKDSAEAFQGEFLLEEPKLVWDTFEPIPVERSLDGQGQVAALVAWSPQKRCEGWMAIRCQEPVLHYLEVEINQQFQVVRPGQILRLKSQDTVKFLKWVTNIQDLNQIRVTEKAIPSASWPWEKRVRQALGDTIYWLEVSYRQKTFARILMSIEEDLSLVSAPLLPSH